MKILMVLTSHDQLGDTGKKTGYWFEEVAGPYYVFKDAGHEVTLASPKGGKPPLDPASNQDQYKTDNTRRFEADEAANAQIAAIVRLDSVRQDGFDTVFYPGGHGPMWDLAEDRTSIDLIEAFLRAGKPIALVCHAPAALRHVTDADGRPIVAGRRVTGFTNSEEAAVGLTDAVPFLLQDELVRLDGTFEKTEDMGVLVVTDGLLTTGQNPTSSVDAAKALLEQVAEEAAG